MRSGFIIFTFISALASLAAAVNIRGFTSYGCSGTQWICYNIAAGTCCNFPEDFRSLSWALPSGTRGIGYSFSSCWGSYPSVFGAQYNSCWNYLGVFTPSSAKWLRVTSNKRSEIHERQEGKCENCAEPNIYVYTTPEGVQRVIDVPAGQAQIVAAYAAKKDWKSLLSYADSKADIDLKLSGEVHDIEGPEK